MGKLTVWAVRVWLIFLIMFGSGCANSSVSLPAETAVPPITESSGTAPLASEELQNSNEREMVMLFRSLLMMEGCNGLQITKAEAAQMLPIVKKCAAAGSLNHEDMKSLTQILSPSQHTYYNEMKEKNRKEAHTSAGGLEKPDKNIEQQLIELLEGKFK